MAGRPSHRLAKAASLVACGLAAWGLAGCSMAHHARPVGKGNQVVHVSVGGPVAGVGEPSMLVPLTTVSFTYGATDRLDVYGGWHVLETFLNGGNAFFDVGASYYWVDQAGLRPGVSTALTISPLLNAAGGWLLIDLALTTSWTLDAADKHLVYLGCHNAMTPIRHSAIETPRYSWSPFVGWQGRLWEWVAVGAEVKWHRPYQSTTHSVTAFVAPGDQGALAFLIGASFFLSGGDGGAEDTKVTP